MYKNVGVFYSNRAELNISCSKWASGLKTQCIQMKTWLCKKMVLKAVFHGGCWIKDLSKLEICIFFDDICVAKVTKMADKSFE